MTRLPKFFLSALLAVAALPPCLAWEDHAQISYLALGSEPWAGETMKAESLERFLEAEKTGLAAALSSFEARAAKELDYYPKLPAELSFKGEGSGPSLRAAFIAAIRLNPDSKLILYVKPAAGVTRTRPPLAIDAVDPFDGRFANQPFEAVAEGEELTALEVLATGSDEPDYGLDCGLYENNGTESGKRYGLGEQPFGNPALDYGSQAPVHMAFAHEDPIIGLAAPFTKRSIADYRFRLSAELARFAFSHGHPYWGYRFAGWALHYVEDLCQPYHASLLPGLKALRILTLNAFGSKADVDAAMIFLSNRHSLIEDYAYRAVAARPAPLVAALEAGALQKGDEPRSGWLYDVVSRRAFDRGRKLDALLVKSFPSRYVADPAYDYGLSNVGATREFDPYGELQKAGPGKAAELDALVMDILADAGAYARAFVPYVRDGAAKEAPRRAPVDLRAAAYIAVLALIAALAVRAAADARYRRKAAKTIEKGGVM